MKVLILGAGGQVGRALVAAAPAWATVTALGRSACDLSDPLQLEQVIRDAWPQLIINAAAYTAVDLAETQAAQAHRINAQAPGEIAGAAALVGARVVHISTDFVFDGASSTPRAPREQTSPLSIYGVSKLEGEHAVLAAAPENLVVRTAWVYASTGRNFVNVMLRMMKEQRPVRVVADQIGTPTYAPSLAGALWGLAGAGASGIYHYTDAGVASWYDFAVAIEEEARSAGLLMHEAEVVPIRTSDYPTAARRPPFSVLESWEAYKLLGAPAPHWRTNLRRNLSELVEHG